MTKINFKKFFVVILACLTCLLSIFSFSACSDENGKEITTEYAFAKLEEKDKKGISRREKLINAYEDYDYIELEVHFYNEETFNLERIVEIYLRNVYEEKDGVIKKIDMQVYTEEYEVETKTTRYTLLKRQLDHVELYTSISVDNDLVKEPAVIHDISEFNEFLDGFFAEFYKEEYLPRTEDVIEKAYKKTLSTDVNRMKSIEILFKNGEAYNEVSFNYDTDKIHFVREYNSERNLLREIEYTYSGNFVTGVKDIDYKKFDMHETCTPKDPVRENEVPSTCNVKGTYDEVIYCALCNEEISREQKEIEEFAPCVDSDENGVCDICKTGGKAKIGEVYYATFEEALTAAQPTDELFILMDLDFATGIEINKEVTINLNGKTLTIKEDTEGNGVFHVVAGGKLTINGDGIVDGSGKNTYNIALWADGGTIIINGGTYKNSEGLDDGSNHFDLIYVKNSGSVIINDGYFECKTPDWTLNSHDKYTGTFIVKGGTFVNYNPSLSKTENPVVSFVAEGYSVIHTVKDGVYIYKVVSFDSI